MRVVEASRHLALRRVALAFVVLIPSAACLPSLAANTAAPSMITPAVPRADAAPVMTVPSNWQDVITHQIEAFRHHDAPGAFSDAAAMFQRSFPNAETFFVTIIGSGYGPIMESTSHSFGKFTLQDSDKTVLQIVRFVGRNQEIYEAIYLLGNEPDSGWRVQGVSLVKSRAIGV